MERRDLLKLSPLALAATVGHVSFAEAQTESHPAEAVYNVRNFGATGDGKTVDTPAINKAIEAVAAAGGGTLVFPAGTYMCFTIRLKSHVDLYLSHGCTIQAADSPKPGESTGYNGGTYDAAEPNDPWTPYQDYGHNHWRNSLLYAENEHDFAVFGPGLIFGKGLSFGSRGQRGDYTTFVAEQPGVGNKTFGLKNCHNVLLRDLSILKGGHFAILATGVDNLTIDNLKIDTNRDGIDVDCCSNVRISNCSVNSPWDDAICPKSSFALGYARATENVTITNCFVSGSYMEGTLLDGTRKPFPPGERVPRNGRIKFGTESNGGFKRITVSNCVCDGCHGIALEAVDGALLEDVTIDNISMRDINDGPIFLRLGDRMRGPEGVPVGALRRVIISNIVCSNATSGISSIITGLAGHLIEDVKLSNIIIEHRGGGTPEQAKREVPEEERDRYPEPGRFGDTPSNAFFIRHVKGIEMNDIKILVQQPDARPAFVLDDTHGVDFFRIKSPKNGNVPTFGLKNVEDFKLSQCNTVPDTHLDKVDNRNL